MPEKKATPKAIIANIEKNLPYDFLISPITSYIKAFLNITTQSFLLE